MLAKGKPTYDACLVDVRVLTATQLSRMLRDARRRTHDLIADLDDEQLLGPRLEIVNPMLWEIGHITWFQEKWALRHLRRERPILDVGDSLFNSATVAHEPLIEEDDAVLVVGDYLHDLLAEGPASDLLHLAEPVPEVRLGVDATEGRPAGHVKGYRVIAHGEHSGDVRSDALVYVVKPFLIGVHRFLLLVRPSRSGSILVKFILIGALGSIIVVADLVDALWVFFDKNRQALHDKVVSTIVVYAPLGLPALSSPSQLSSQPHRAAHSESIQGTASELRELAKLHEEGILTDEEYEAKKRELADQL